jgi:hypothetical protein
MGITTKSDIALVALKANTASLALTASYFSGSISNATSASYAETASYFSGSITNATSASYAETASFALTASFVATASWANNARSASFASTASYFSGSISNATFALTASVALSSSVTNTTEAGGFPVTFVRVNTDPSQLLTDSSSLYYNPANGTLFTTSSRAISASRADTATTANRISVASDTTTNDFLEVLFAKVAGVAVDVKYDSTVFNFNPSTNRLFITSISSSTITGSSFTGSFTGSLFGTSSWAVSSSQAITASYILNAISASFASTASYFSGSITNATSASYALSASIAATASYFSGSITNATSASYASTASIAQRIEVTDLSTSPGAYEILFVTSTGSQIAYAELNNFTYNPIVDTLTVGIIGTAGSPTAVTGSLFGTASWANNVVAANYSNAVSVNPDTTSNIFYPVPFASTAFGNANLYSDSSVINFNPSTNRLFITNISSSAITGSSFTGSFTGSLLGTSSWATSASWAPGGGSAFPYVGAAKITGSLVVSGSTGGIDTINGVLSNSGSISKVDWINGYLNTTAGINVVDWENKFLYDEAGASIDWTNRVLYETSNTFEALNYSNSASVSSQLYYNNVIPRQVQRSLADTPAYGGQVIQADVTSSAALYNVVYLDTDGIWYPLKNLSPPATKMLGICVDTAGYVLIEGDIGVSDDNSQGAYVIGAGYGLPVYLGSTNGVMTTTVPTTGVVRVLGHVYYKSTTDANWWTMKFRPSTDWYEI